MNPLNSTLNSNPATFMIQSQKKIAKNSLKLGGTSKIKLTKDILGLKEGIGLSEMNSARSEDQEDIPLLTNQSP